MVELALDVQLESEKQITSNSIVIGNICFMDLYFIFKSLSFKPHNGFELSSSLPSPIITQL